MAKQGLAAGRRQFLAGSASLLVGAALPLGGRLQARDAAAQLVPNAFVRVDPDDTITVLVKHIEFGQGPLTGLATLVADEMDADWSQMRAETAPADVTKYANPLFQVQGTGGSTAMRTSWAPMRKAGAQARAMLMQAAAEQWGVPVAELTVQGGRIKHPSSNRETGFGAMVERAAGLEVPEDPPLKDASQRTLIGRDGLPKLDTRGKARGETTFTMDVFRDGMLTVALKRPPAFGATLESVDAEAAMAVKGVRKVAAIPAGVAVYADNTFAAFKGRDAVTANWSTAEAETRSSEEITAYFRDKALRPGPLTDVDRGDAAGALDAAAQSIDAVYTFPFLAHCPMEPLDAVLEYTADGGAEAWLGSQLQTLDQSVIAQTLGIEDPMLVKINTMFAGGSFGRRAQHDSHLAAETAQALKESPDRRPVKLVYSREDDFQAGYYRPIVAHRIRAGIDADGEITGWDQVIAAPSFFLGTLFEGFLRPTGVDPTITEGARDMPYAIPNFRLGVHQERFKVPTLWWRAVGHTHTAYAAETAIDELLELAGKDPVEGRLALLGDSPRDAAVLRRAAELADWGRAAPEGHAFGVAVHKSFGTYVAQIAQISIENEEPRLHKVWCAVDCGVAVNPDVIRAQMEGGIGYGAGGVMFDAVQLGEGGRVRQKNWDSYRILRIDEMPDVEVAIIDSDEDPMGVGEPGTPPIGPAIGNAVRRLLGETPRDLPMVTPIEV